MGLDQVIEKIPKPILVGGVLVLALVFFIMTDPLRDECEIQKTLFEKNTEGLLSPAKMHKKIQYPKIDYWLNSCRFGNSIGACDDYLNGLKAVATELKSFSVKCQLKYLETNETYLEPFKNALKILPLLAWGEKPPEGPSARLGWLSEPHLRTFCALKSNYINLAGEEEFLKIRNSVYLEYPDNWSDKVPIDARTPENRPKALKTALNPEGSLSQQQVYERSLFSMRCDLYL